MKQNDGTGKVVEFIYEKAVARQEGCLITVEEKVYPVTTTTTSLSTPIAIAIDGKITQVLWKKVGGVLLKDGYCALTKFNFSSKAVIKLGQKIKDPDEDLEEAGYIVAEIKPPDEEQEDPYYTIVCS